MPAHVRKVGGTKKLNIKEISEIGPDLIIANKEENDQMEILELSKSFPVYISDIENLEDALGMIKDVGTLTNTSNRCFDLANDIQRAYSALPNFSEKTVLYFIWRAPYMCAGKGTYIQFHLDRLGLQNMISGHRYPEITNEMISDLAPEYILLSSEPYPFKDEHILELKALSPDSKVILVDGEMFSWYGNRMLLAAEYFKGLYDEIEG